MPINGEIAAPPRHRDRTAAPWHLLRIQPVELRGETRSGRQGLPPRGPSGAPAARKRGPLLDGFSMRHQHPTELDERIHRAQFAVINRN